MIGLVLLKLKRGLWFFACFMLILLFCSLPLKNTFDNYVIALVALAISVAVIPIYVYRKRRKNPFYVRAYFSLKYDERAYPSEKFKKSRLFIHFKAEAYAAAFGSILTVSGMCYYLCRGKSITETLMLGAIFSICSFAAIMILDYIVWTKTVAFFEKQKLKNKK